MIQLAAANAQGRLKGYFNHAIIGPRLLVVDELGYSPRRSTVRSRTGCPSPMA
jgi:DNA replication protein DnaC